MNIKNLVNYQKLISVMTATCLLVSFVIGPTAASAINNEQTTKEYNQIFREFILPYSYGKITNSHFAGTDRVIINIQDLHCHPKVQKNIANIIETFDKKFGVKKIYLEGAYGDVSTKWIVDKIENNKQIVEQMLDTGRLTGAEYYSALSGKTDLIKGLEEKEPYLDNIKRLGKILQDQENIDLILKSLHECTDKVKKKYYTKRQYKLEKLFNEYKEGKIPSQKYYTLLSKHIDKLGIDLTKYENSLIYVTLLDLQKDLSYKQATRELQELIFVLKQQLPYNAYKSLLENTKNFKEIEKLYSYIIQLDKIYNLNVSSNFKELDKYFRYVELSKKINPVELVKEDEFLIQEINTRFAQTKAQQDVVFLIYFEKYLKDYLTTKITLDDYKYYQENINRYIQVYNKYVDNRVLSLLSGYIRETDKFYNINLDRNTYFTKNIFKEKECLNQIENISSAQDEINKIIDNMQQVKELDIVVTGGFHSQTITELLESQNVSYIVITPNVTDGIKLAEDTYYELAKEQSKIAFQTIAPIIASLSPKRQELLLEKVGNIQQEEIEKIIGLDDNGRAKIISELMAANLLESDDLGYVETTLQNIIKDIVDDLHKEKVTPELISKIKNLQSLLKYKEKLQRVIDLLNEGTAKQAVMLVGDMLTNIYNIFDSFLSFANKTLSQQEQEFSVTDFDTDESFDEDIEKEDIDNVYEKEEIYDDDLDLWFSDADIIKVCREIIKVGKNNKDIKDFIWYLGKYNIADYELLNKILSELKTLNDSKEIQEYCGIIYTLTNKDRITSKEKAIKTKENIMSFFEKPKTLQLKFCNLFSKLFVGHDYLRENFFNALLDFVNKNEYTDKDFDFLLTVCKYSFLISDLGTKENIYDFLTLDMEKRKLLYSFYQSPKMYTDIDINRLTLNFILSVLNKYNFSNEQFDYIMRLVCSANITNTSSEQKYIESLKEKEVNMFVLENFKYIDTYNRYLLDLLFSDVDEKNVENFVSKIQTIVNLFDDLRYYKIDTLETENKGLALSVFLNDVFEKYCKDNNIYDLVKQYQLAIRVSRKMYSILGDNIFTLPGDKTDNIIKETLDYYNKIDKIISSLTLFTNKTAIFSLHNNERNFDRKTFRFTPAGIKEIFKRLDIEPEVFEAVEISFMDKVLDFIKTIKQDEIDKQILFDFVNNLDGSEIIKKDILQYLAKKKESTISKKAINRYVNRLKITERFLEVKHFLSHIEHFNDYGQEKGIFIFDGHGIDDGIFYTENSKITVEQLAQSLINAHNNGVNLENLTLMFSSCHSYKFADNIINELINNGITAFPQIITDAGKETVYGYTTTVDLDGKQTKVSNLFYSLMKYLDSKTPEQLQKMKGRLTFKELADAPRYLSNNTVFVTNQQITKLNRDLEKNIHDIIEENGTDNEENMYSVIKNGTYASSHNQYAQLQLPSTKKALDNLGKNKVIKKIYRAKAGENFKNTRLGVAIGVLMETFVFWLPSFVSKHQFDKTQTSGANAVVWRIKALSIGIGIIPVVLSILNPIIAAFIIPVILLTKSVLQYNYDTQKSRINIRLSKYEKPIVVLIEKNGNRYSLIFSPSSGSVFLSSINEDAFDHETSKYKDSKSIEEFLGIKIKFSKHRLSVKDYNAETNIKFTKYSNISEIAQSLNTQDILSPEQSKIDLIKNDRKCTDVEYVYLDRAEKENRDKIKYAIDNHKLLVLYPFSKTCDIDSLTDEQLCALYLQISTYFINMVDVLLPKDILPRLMDDNSKIKGMEDFLLELIKNAFVYGNLADPSKPIYIDCGKDNFTVYNSYNETEKTSKKRLSFAAMAALSGAHRGLNTIQHYADEALITVTSQEERIRQIGDNKDDKYYAITVERIKPKVEQKKAEQKIKDISRYLKINDFEITRQRFEDVLEYLQNNDYEITEDTYEYIRYFLYVSAVDVGWMISYKFEFFKKLFDLSDSSKKFVYDFRKQNEAEIKGNPNVLSIIINIVKDYDNNQFSEEEFKTLLNLIMQLSDRIGSYVKDKDVHLTEIITNNRVSNFFLQYYLQNKKFFYDKDYKTLIAYLIFSEGTNIEYYAKQTYFDSEIKMLFKNMVEHKIHDLNMFYNGLTMKIYLNPIFKELLEQEYNKNNENLTSLVRYRVALVIAQNLYVHLGEKINLLNEDDINKIMYECVQDIINKKNLLKQRFLFSDESDFMGEENDDGKISFEEGKDFGINKGKASNTGIIGISNSELDENGARFFSLSGIGSVLNFIENTPRLLMNLEVEGTSDVKDKKEKLLKMIEEYIYLKKNYGLSNLVVVINGHGDDYNIYLNGKEYEITRTELAQALLQAYKNGANLEEITLNLAACSSYAFCENLFKTLKSLERNENLEIKLPNIITEAGKEIKPGFGKKIVFRRNVTDTQRITIYIGNAVYSLFMYVKNKIVNNEFVSKYLTLNDVFDSGMYYSNHTIFISGQEVEKINTDFREKLFELLGEDFIKEDEVEKIIKTAQMQLPSTQKILNKFGENFRFTKLGVALGVLIELFSFWGPNFIKNHNFDPSIQTKMTAVVWVIRALSIGIGLGSGVIL
ncbi:MAG: hypothetical protein IKN42_01930, partial [Elusimicrobia bacterium]|nr:hypothetical protein [Elusimicrobiota bacterium]